MNTTLLVIDDSEDDLRLYRHALAAFGWSLETAASATEGLLRLGNGEQMSKPALILLDYNLPDLDGISFMKELGKSAAESIPIVMLTGEDSTEVAVEAMKHGACDYLVKDVEGRYLRLLPAVIGRVLAAQAQRNETRRLQRETETLLRRNHLLMQTSMDGIHVLDAEGNLLEANDAFYRMLGYSQQELVGRNVSCWDAQWSPKEMRERLREFVGKSARFETVHRRKNGSLLEVEISFSNVDIDGQNFSFAASRDISERKRTEAAQRQHNLLIEASIDGFWMTDMQGNLLEANEAYAKISGYTVDELLGMHISQLEAVESSPEDVQEHIAKVVEQGHDRFETRHIRKDGKEIDIEMSVIYLPQNQQISGFCRDISERKHAETALMKSEANLRAMLDNSPYLTWLKDARGRYVTINKIFADYLNLEDPAQAIGKTDYDLQPAEMAKKYLADDNEVMASRQQKHVEESAFDGKRAHWVETYKTPVIDVHGKILGTVGFARDISERKRSEEALLKSEANMRAILDNSPYLVWLKDADGRYITVNKTFAAYLRLEDAREATGKTDLDLWPSDLAEKYRGDDAEVMASRQQKHHEEPVLDGEKMLWVEIYKTPIIDVHGKVLGTVGFAMDISERKKIEQELLVLNDQLTHEVAKRTADLSELAAHIQNIAETERANIARELHDELGNTLVGLNMEVALLKGKISAPELLQDLTLIGDLVTRANQTTRAVVNQLYPTILDNDGFIAAVEWLVAGYQKYTGIAVELRLPEHIPMDHSYALAAYRITQECLTNIAKHAEASHVLIEAITRDGFLDMVIRDDGKGLSAEHHGDGRGIFGMIERARFLGGSLQMDGIDGEGTTVHLRLPSIAAKPKNKRKVLVVDDHAIVRDAIKQLLESQTEDFSVEGEASDGKMAVQLALSGEWDIMLLDITLPKKSGIKALEEIHAVKPALPIIMLSSHAADEYERIALAKGAACYIEKSETEKLVEAMRRVLALSR